MLKNTYKIVWTIEVEADYARHAAKQALEIMQDKESTATVFEVTECFGKEKTHTIDLGEQCIAKAGANIAPFLWDTLPM